MASTGPKLIYPLRYATRLRGYDYSQGSCYFVTICVHERKAIWGTVSDTAFRPNRLGEIAAETWVSIPSLFLGVELDSWVIMPNHCHGIIVLPDKITRGSRAASTPTQEVSGESQSPIEPPPSLARVINGYKSVSAKLINRHRGCVGEKVWQRSFYDHVVRDQWDLDAIREYINNNPLKWSLDEENPESE